ncbi:TonB-dependent receptor [Novosphingobium profundi]|uniref:TonB-dependent receptor n=1 Tax=Novosphingobium profundi TaxID=1774954 RepID=UPI001BDAA299|nr:TonB-dependent receptor [Novosphingobium profundi]MBT0671305.1 TonB-dependent receptor [Novosphingobium profundi]
MRTILRLFATTSCLMPMVALAAEPASPSETAADATADGAATNEILVIGQGEVRQTQTVTAVQLAQLAPGTSPFKAIENLPSVNFQAADPFGAYEWATRLSIRGFNQNALGFTLDGVPLGDASYGNVNGLHVSRAITTENIGTIEVSQGAGALGTQATNNLGGTVLYTSTDPLDHFAVDANGTLGSWDDRRSFVRVNLGTHDGPRGYVSYVYSASDKWKGTGQQKQQMADAKIVVPLGSATELTGYFDYSDRKENDYQDMSQDMIDRLGYRWDNVSNDYALAVAAGQAYQNGTDLPSPYATVDDAYFNAAGLRTDYLGYVGLTSQLSEAVTFKAKGYYHRNDGMGIWYTPYVASSNGSTLSIRTTEYGIRRGGGTADVTAKLGDNTLSAGGWFESNAFNQARRYYDTASDTDPGYGLLDRPTDPFYTQWEGDYLTTTWQYYVQDTWTRGNLTLNGGWKGFSVAEKADAVVAGLATGKITSKDWFQPSFGANYRLGHGSEIYASFSQATQAFTAAGTSGPFSTTQDGFDAIKDELKPQSSDTYEVGYRYADAWLSATLGAYLVNFHNRLLAVTTGSGIEGNPSVLQNVGGVRSLGLEALLHARLSGALGATLSYSYNDSTYRDDVTTYASDNTATVTQLRGKTVVDAPRHMARAELAYDDEALFGRIGVDYMSKRAYTYTNDQWVGGRALVDASLGYRFANSVTRSPIEVQVNVTNLFDTHYVATVGTNGFSNSGDAQTLSVGAPRAVFGTIKLSY